MTDTTVELTASADARLKEYLSDVRAALAGVPGVNSTEVEADIRDHVQAALRPVGNAATLGELEAVLTALGPPTGWRPAGPEPTTDRASIRDWLRGIGEVLWRGPEDWRLAYLVLICLMLAVPTMGLSLIAVYLLGRAAIELAHQSGHPLGARRWLIYPPVVLVSGALLVATLAPPLAMIPASEQPISRASNYRELVQAVAADGTVTFRPGVDPMEYRTQYRLHSTGINSHHHKANKVWTISESDRKYHERVLEVLDHVPLHEDFQAAGLIAFLTLGSGLGWLLLLAGISALFPQSVAFVFCPLLNWLTRTQALRATAALTLATAAWLGAAQSLMS